MIWSATDPALRQPPTEEALAAAFDADTAALARIRAEVGFYDSVVQELAPWVANIPRVRASVLANALDSKRDDQWEWMKRFEKMTDKDFLG